MRKLSLTDAGRIVILGAFLSGSRLYALPFKIDLGLTPPARLATNGNIFITDLKESKVIEQRKMEKLRFHTFDFPKEGLYSIELKSAKGEIVWKETVYALLKIPSNEYLMRASWALQPGTMRTVLRVQDPSGEMQYGVSIRDKIFLKLKMAPRLVRVFQEDYTGTSFAAQNVSIGPVTEKAAREENANNSLPDVTFELGDGDDQTSFEPAYKGLLAGKEDRSLREKVLALGGAQMLKPLNRKHRVYAWARIMQEGFEVRKNPDTYKGEKSQGFGTGFGGDYVVKDTLHLQIEIDTHGTKTEYQAGGSNPPASEQKRVHARVNALMDVLNAEHKYPNWGLEVGPVVGYTQVPLEKDNEGKMDFGGSIRGQYYGDKSQVETQFRWMKSHSYDLSLNWIGRGYQSYTLSPIFGLYSYHTEFDAAEAKAEFDEFGVRFGIQREF